MVHTLNLTEFEKNMPAADSKTVPVARSDLTTPWLGKGLPRPVRMHVTGTSPTGCHVNTEHSSKLKTTEQTQSITKLFGTQMPKSN